MITGIAPSFEGVQQHKLFIPGYTLLAAGASNSVQSRYTARHVVTGAMVDVTVSFRSRDMEPQRWENLLAQCRSLLQMQQPLNQNRNIQSVLDFGETPELFYVVSEPVEGRTLREILAAEGPRPLEWLLPILTQIGSAFDYAASYKLDHTALTPDRIVISSDGERACIKDFALARFCRLPGSPYTAPEQLTRTGDQRRTDMYSLGAIFYECLSGRPPFTGTNEEEIRQKIMHGSPRFLLNQPIYVREIITHMMMRLPEHRYATFIDMTTDLQLQRCPPAIKQAALVDLAHELKLTQLKLDDEAVVDAVIANPPRVTGPGLLVHKIQVFWRAMSTRLTLRLPRHDAPTKRVVRKRRDLEDAENETDSMGLWAWLMAVLQSSLTGVSYRHRPPTENPAVYKDSPAWRRAKKRMFRAFRRACAALVLVLIVTVCHSASLLNQKAQRRHVIVRAVHGQHVTRASGAHDTRLQIDDQLDVASGPTIRTGADSTVTLEMPGVQLKIAPNSIVQIKQEIGDQGVERQLDLQHGQIWAALQRSPTPADLLEIRHGAQTVEAQGTQFAVIVTPEGGLKATAYQGDLLVFSGLQRKAIQEGQKLNMRPEHRLIEPDALSEEDRNAGESVFSSLEENVKAPASLLAQLYRAYLSLQENTVEPIVSKGLVLAHLTPPAQKYLDATAINIQTQGTLIALGKTLSINGEPLPALTPDTLEETGLLAEDRNKWLQHFFEHRVLYYKPHGDANFTLYVRANDSGHTLWKLENEGPTPIPANDEDKELAPLLLK